MVRAATLLFLLVGTFLCLTGGASEPSGNIATDLQSIYKQTQNAASEAELTEIARACSKIIPDEKRSAGDREYASKLFAWSLNRRGELRNERAGGLVAAGKFSEAQQVDKLAGRDFETATEYAPDNWRIHHNLAISLAMQGNYEAAIKAFDRVIQLQPDYPNAHYNRAELFFEKEMFQNAEAGYTKAIELAAGDARYFNGRAHARFMLNDTNAAIADYSQAAELESNNAAYLTDLADALQSIGKWEDAANRYRQAVAVNKTYARAYRNIAWLLATCPEKRFRNPTLALNAAKKAIELEGDKDYRSLDTLAAATAATGDTEKASQLVRDAINAAPEQARAELTVRSSLYAQGERFVQEAPRPIQKATVLEKSEVRTASAEMPIKRK